MAGLRAYPTLNASLDGTNVVLHKEINVGIAVALDLGADRAGGEGRRREESAWASSATLNDLAERARSKKLKPEEVQEGTFSITKSRRVRRAVRAAGDQPAERGDPRPGRD